jgi:hypothetical protein
MKSLDSKDKVVRSKESVLQERDREMMEMMTTREDQEMTLKKEATKEEGKTMMNESSFASKISLS